MVPSWISCPVYFWCLHEVRSNYHALNVHTGSTTFMPWWIKYIMWVTHCGIQNEVSVINRLSYLVNSGYSPKLCWGFLCSTTVSKLYLGLYSPSRVCPQPAVIQVVPGVTYSPLSGIQATLTWSFNLIGLANFTRAMSRLNVIGAEKN